MEQEVLRVNFAHPVPLFPLPNCVLLPHATIPLHIFESRYRTMTSDSLDSRGLIAMATFAGKTWKDDYEGNPPVRPHVCVGYIVKHDRFDDGRYNLLLQGVCRARIINELEESTPYRQAVLEPVDTSQTMEVDLDDHRRRIEAYLHHDTLKSLKIVNAIHHWLTSDVPTTAVIDLTIMAICEETEQRYAMLAETDPGTRAAWLEGLLARTRTTIEIAERLGSGEDIDGVFLN